MPVGQPKMGRSWWRDLTEMWSTGEGNGKPLQYSCLENPMNSMKRQKDRTLKEELPRSVGAQYTTGDQWRNNSRKNEGMEPNQKQRPVVDVTGDRSKVRCCKEQYCMGTWNLRSMNQGKLEVVRQEMARVNVDILGISKLRWTGTGEFNSDDHYIYYCGQESLRRNGVAIMVNERVQNAVLGCNLKKKWCFWTVVLEKTLENPLDCREIQPVHSNGDQSWVFFGRNDAEAETPGLWPPHAKSWLIGKDPDAGRDWGQEEKGATEDEIAGWHHRLNGHEFEWTPGVGDGQGGLACCDSWGRKELDTTERLNWAELNPELDTDNWPQTQQLDWFLKLA